MNRRNDSRNLFYTWQIGKATSYLRNLSGVDFFAFLIRSFKKIQIINLLPQLFYERISEEVFTATTFHGLSCRRCTGHLSCCRADGRTWTANLILTKNLHCHYATSAKCLWRDLNPRPFRKHIVRITRFPTPPRLTELPRRRSINTFRCFWNLRLRPASVLPRSVRFWATKTYSPYKTTLKTSSQLGRIS